MANPNEPKIGLLITDFDGTIKPLVGPVPQVEAAALKTLGQLKVVRAVATGRSLESFRLDWSPDLELDYLIYSSGLALCRFGRTGPLEHLFLKAFAPSESSLALDIALALGWGFVAFKAPPNSHHFYYLDPLNCPPSPGQVARVNRFQEVATPWPGYKPHEPLSQVLIMAPAEEFPQLKDRFQSLAPNLSITLSSSPYGDGRIWLEVFPGGVTKGSASAALADLLGLTAQETVAVGNDYNDENLLAWAGRGFVVADAPLELRRRFSPLKDDLGVLSQVMAALGLK
ncbi:MAG: Cof-type HAD-IIB family hydrolase [Deltaproteobacteria bacterium]|nr:Cof-type HAD-IIB family hydrolase [Deltaproteobacteria bacterium]